MSKLCKLELVLIVAKFIECMLMNYANSWNLSEKSTKIQYDNHDT